MLHASFDNPSRSLGLLLITIERRIFTNHKTSTHRRRALGCCGYGDRQHSWTVDSGQWSLGWAGLSLMLRLRRVGCSDWPCAEWCHLYVTASLTRPLLPIDAVAVFIAWLAVTDCLWKCGLQWLWHMVTVPMLFYGWFNQQAKMSVHRRHEMRPLASYHCLAS